ncbi:class I SAM-dependent methyltransferase [Sulfuricurvum sp.]|uniref:class I SAM-dependent methyltransferase n=1 Tax=Sulfuricurvum sp. TaxID=2025608 RepID=UPI00261F8ED2|nr:class I SAM-dependent methyltransferase [Sulfuricurvum sp.]MDD3596691.1 class I SAM-dependent methyltransferase [Sulfuricurvum sp.]
MNDLERMKTFYETRSRQGWSVYECYPFFLACKQKWILTKILKHIETPAKKLLDIGAGEGDFLLTMIRLGFSPSNITAVEYLSDRIERLHVKLPQVESHCNDYLKLTFPSEFDIITLMAVLTSIVDNDVRYSIVSKALEELKEGGILIIYDFFNDKEPFLHPDYRAASLKKIKEIAISCSMTVHKKVYLKSKYAKGLCKIGLPALIPLFEALKLFNDNYHFIVIRK